MPISLPPGNNTSSAGASGAVVNHEYTVQPGDTLFTIARKLGVSMTDLQNANGLLNPNMLQVGQKLRVP
jgi:LysM repeat protein